MRFSEYLCDGCLLESLTATTKEAALEELAACTAAHGINPAEAVRVLREREHMGTTAVGKGVAIPHGKMPGLAQMVAVFGRSERGIDCGAPDGEPCYFFFMVLAPEGAAGQQLALLGAIARLVRNEAFRCALAEAQGEEGLRAVFAAA